MAPYKESMKTDIEQHSEAALDVSQLNVAIISDAAPGRNGVGTFYVDLVKHLEKHVNKIEILSPTVVDEKWQAGLVFPLPGDPTQKLCMPNPLKMKRELEAIQPHIILVATPGVYGIVGATLAALLKIPAIAGFHTSFEKITELYWQNSFGGMIVHGYFKVSNGYLFKRCPLIVANSQEMIEQAKSIGAKNTRIVSTPVSSTFTLPATTAYSGKLKRVLFAGRLAPEKNIEGLLVAIEQHPDIQFTLAGDGPLRELVEEKSKALPNLISLGWLAREELRQQIDAHDALVLPSHFESFGTIALEAMARERLVIVSQHCGIVEWEEFNKGFYIIESTLSKALSSISALSDAERTELSQKAKSITEAVNQKSTTEWCNLLLENACKRASAN